MAVRLANETSPYLLQHLDNPVDWHPWGPAAMRLAQESDRPILLSIGYSACHWCHVMAHESFENDAIAELMNKHFVNIKVDREERPDVDAVYMEAVQAMTGHGGWPLTAFLTPEGEPFYGGTYFPPAPRQGMPGFPQILSSIAAAWEERRDEVLRSATGLRDALRSSLASADSAMGDDADPGDEILNRATRLMLEHADPENGGFGRAPKFPQASALTFLMAGHHRSGDASTLAILRAALDGMRLGGIRDHLAGGFHRYSVDARWAVPHFEKMLYDNAQLARLYLEAFQLTGAPAYREIAEETLDYLLREMQGSSGGFFAAQDADTSEGEGAYFSWRPDEVRALLDETAAEAFIRRYGISDGGNFEKGRTVLGVHASMGEIAEAMGLELDAVDEAIRNGKRRLLAARELRPRPMTDEKILAAWNGLAIDAFARAGAVLGREDYIDAATWAAEFVLTSLRTPDGGLTRAWKDGDTKVPAFLDDHAAMGGACVSLYEAGFDRRWLDEARALAMAMLEQFSAPDGAGFLRSGSRHEKLFLEQKDLQDGALPGGNALAADLLLRLAAYDLRPDWIEAAEGALRAGATIMARSPLSAGALLSSLDDARSGFREIVIIGDGEEAKAMVDVIRNRYLPGSVVAWAVTAQAAQDSEIPLLRDRSAGGASVAAFVCHRGTCAAPVTSSGELAALLDAP